MRVFFGDGGGDLRAVSVLTVLTVLSLLAISALVQTLARNEAQAGAYGSIVGTGLALFGGSFFPLFQMPEIAQRLSAFTPNGWALRGFTDIAYDGATLADLVPNVAAIAAFTIVCGSIAAMRARAITLR